MIIPAGGHALWVAYFAERDIHDAKSEARVTEAVQLSPVIGWVVDDEDEDPKPIPITPDGLVNSEPYLQWTGDDKKAVKATAIDSAVTLWASIPFRS